MLQETRPLVSIITVTFNAASTLEACIKSVLLHKNGEVEFVVIDGGSKDGTLEILERYGNAVDVLVSEPDQGIYDAMNKGLDRANGDYVLFLGADDLLRHLPLNEMDNRADLILGNVDCGGWNFRHVKPEAHLRAKMRYRNCVHPQGTFYRKSDIRYSLEYRCCADYLFNLEYLERFSKITYCEEAISKFCTTGTSSGWAAKREAIRIASRFGGVRSGILSFAYHLSSHFLNAIRKHGKS